MSTLLDRYVLGQWLRIFLVTAIGFPVVAALIEATDKLKTLLDRGIPMDRIALGYLFVLPEKLFEIIPAAVLVATVFTVGNLGRHSEITAAKAGGVSFHRLTLPIYAGALVAVALTLVVEEVAPVTSARQIQLHGENRPTTQRFNFVFRADEGWVYTIRKLDAERGVMHDVVLTRQGTGAGYPSLLVSADSATWKEGGGWTLWNGTSRSVASGELQATFGFRALRLRPLREPPTELLASAKKPEEMRYAELGRYIDAVERSGNDAGRLRVLRELKLAIPATCLVIALFGAPLAMTSYRSGTAMGIGISLATTIVFLLLVQLSQAVGGSGLLDPAVAAWMPNGIFLAAAAVLLARART